MTKPTFSNMDKTEMSPLTGNQPPAHVMPIVHGVPMIADYVGTMNEAWLGIHYGIAESAKQQKANSANTLSA